MRTKDMQRISEIGRDRISFLKSLSFEHIYKYGYDTIFVLNCENLECGDCPLLAKDKMHCIINNFESQEDFDEFKDFYGMYAKTNHKRIININREV